MPLGSPVCEHVFRLKSIPDLDAISCSTDEGAGQMKGGRCRACLSQQILGGGNELMVHDPFWEQAVLIWGYAGSHRVQLSQDTSLPQSLVAVVGGHAVRQAACKPDQYCLPQLQLCIIHHLERLRSGLGLAETCQNRLCSCTTTRSDLLHQG